MKYEKALNYLKKLYNKEKDAIITDGSLDFDLATTGIVKLINDGDMTVEKFLKDLRE